MRVEINEQKQSREKKFIEELVKREISAVVLKMLETVSRFGQAKVRELELRGISLSYAFNVEHDRERFRLVIEVAVPRWYIAKLVAEKQEFARILRSMNYNVRRAEQYMSGLPDIDVSAAALQAAMIAAAEKAAEEEEAPPAEDVLAPTADGGSGGGGAVASGEGGNVLDGTRILFEYEGLDKADMLARRDRWDEERALEEDMEEDDENIEIEFEKM